jgi:hypothetical protein
MVVFYLVSAGQPGRRSATAVRGVLPDQEVHQRRGLPLRPQHPRHAPHVAGAVPRAQGTRDVPQKEPVEPRPVQVMRYGWGCSKARPRNVHGTRQLLRTALGKFLNLFVTNIQPQIVKSTYVLVTYGHWQCDQ